MSADAWMYAAAGVVTGLVPSAFSVRRSRADRVRAKAAVKAAKDAAVRDAAASRAAGDTAKKHKAELASAAAELDRVQADLAAYAAWCGRVEAELRHLAEGRLPAVADAEARRRPGVVVPGLLDPGFAGTPVGAWMDTSEVVLRGAIAAVGDASRAGVRGMAEEVQAALTRLQMRIDEELGTGPGTDRTQLLEEFDRLATLGRHTVQRLRILTGSWPGRQWADCPVWEVVEGARGRVPSHERVDYTYQPDTGDQFVEGRVAEALVITLTELLGNSVSYSGDVVSVYVRDVPAGLGVVVEDSGAGMNASQRADAARVLSRARPVDVASITDERRLGFAVIAQLAHAYGFRVDVDAPSQTGGVKAVLLIPRALLADRPPAPVPVARPPIVPVPAPHQPAAPAPPPVPAGEAGAGGVTASGLPRRRRGAHAAPTGRAAPPVQEPVTRSTEPEELSAGFVGLRAAFGGHQDNTAGPGAGPDATDGGLHD